MNITRYSVQPSIHSDRSDHSESVNPLTSLEQSNNVINETSTRDAVIKQDEYKVTKYNYKDSRSYSTKLLIITKNKITSLVYRRKTSEYKKIVRIRGIVFGSRTGTFKKVRHCIPSLCISVVCMDRTYDFQLENQVKLLSFLGKVQRIVQHDIKFIMIDAIAKKIATISKRVDENYTEYFKKILILIKFKILNDSHECPICYTVDNTNLQLVNCKHIFCKQCITTWETKCHECNKKFSCPLCREYIYNLL